MFVTEQEAKSKWCPHSRVVAKNGLGPCGNRVNDCAADGSPAVPEAAFCIGSHCMAWRWENKFQRKPSDSTHGYCGLAGAPRT
jgi:hypothetical protein